MSSETATPKKPSKPQGLIRLDKIDQEIVQQDAGVYYLLIESIMQNKRLVAEIADRYLEERGLYVVPKAEEDAKFTRKHPELTKTLAKADQEMKTARAQIRKRRQALMDLVR